MTRSNKSAARDEKSGRSPDETLEWIALSATRFAWFAFAVAAVFSSFAGAPGASAATGNSRPNIIFILADDLGYSDLGVTGSKFHETPNLDRLASQSLQLTRFYQMPNCAPTRACLMSGQYATRTGVYTVDNLDRGWAGDRKMHVPENVIRLPLDRKTIADQLAAAGYRTGMFGKWHLGSTGEYHPARRGFHEAIVVDGNHFGFLTNPEMPVPPDVIDGDWITDRAEVFITRHKDRSFFLYLPHKLPHSPLQAKPELEAKYRKKPPVSGQRSPIYAAMVESVDQSVGRIMAKLDALDLAKNTVLIFASDNGGTSPASNAPLRGIKGQHYEGGLRVPFFVRWPGVVSAGSRSDTVAAHVDLYATFLEIAGAPAPRHPLDGESLLPLLRDPTAKLKRDAIYGHLPGYLERANNPDDPWRSPPVGHIIRGDWKLLEFFEDDRVELYNVREDPGEESNLAAQMPERVRELRTQLAAWRRATGATMPVMKTAAELQADRQLSRTIKPRTKSGFDEK